MAAFDPAEAPAVPAGTIVLLRDHASNGLEMLMVVRHRQIDFAAGALVFPGGRVERQDEDPALSGHCDGMAQDTVIRAAQVGAIRETYEEAGLLLARPDGDRRLIAGARLSDLNENRRRRNAGIGSLLDMLRRHHLRLACDQLTRFAHWVTPAMLPKRYDTHFFLAPAPADQRSAHDGRELVDSLWMTPHQVIADAQAGTRIVMFPTLRNVEKLADFTTVADAVSSARSRPVVTVTPWIEQRDDGKWLCIPPEAGYAVCEAKMRDDAP